MKKAVLSKSIVSSIAHFWGCEGVVFMAPSRRARIRQVEFVCDIFRRTMRKHPLLRGLGVLGQSSAEERLFSRSKISTRNEKAVS